jgi:hypothetical protein
MTTRFKSDRISLPNGIVQRTYFISQYLVALLLGVGAPTVSVVKFVALFVCLIAVGGLLWSIANQSRHVSSTEFIGVGFVVGLTFAIFFDQLFVFWGQRSPLIWSILIASVAVLSPKIDLKSSSFWRTDKKNLGEIYVLFAFVAFGLAGFANGMQAIAFVSLIFAALTILLLNKRSSATFLAVNFINGAACFLALRFFQSTETYGPIYLRHLFSGSDDLLFSESLSNSIIHFGPWDSLSSPGYPVPYHWFSAAATALIQTLIGAEPFFVTTLVAPILGVLVIVLLVSAVVKEFVPSVVGRCIAFAGILVGSTIPLARRDFQVFESFAPSNILSFFWSLTAILCLIVFSKHKRSIYVGLFVLFSVLTLLAKVPHGLILFVFSFLYLMVLSILKSLQIREILPPVVFVLAGYLLIGFVFLRPSPWQDRAFSFPVNSANLAVNSAWYPTIPVLLVAVFALTRFPFLSIPIWRYLSVYSKAFLFSALGTGVISLLRFAVFGATAESYFLNIGLLLGSLASGICIGTYWDTLSSLGKKILCFAFCLSLLTYSIVLLQIRSSSTTAPLIMFPFVISLVSGLSIFLLRGFRSYSFSRVFLASVLSFGLLGASVAVHLTTKFDSDSIRFSSDVVALDELDALNWLRKNSDANQLLATNRNLCGDDAACILNETHQVISAFTGRAVLIEGPRFLNGARNYPDWAQYRINTSLEFAQSPSSQSARLLKIQGVDLYYLVKAGTKVDHNNVRFLELAHLVYENSSIAIYDFARL